MKLFVFSIFSVLLIFLLTIQPFEIPDEQSHLSSVRFLANEGRMPTILDKDNLSLEEYKAQEVFGVQQGKNKYSYHPEYRLLYATGVMGIDEDYIKSLNTRENRFTYQGFEAATYPPLYYVFSLPFYNSVFESDIITRIFVTRFSSVIFTLITVIITYLIGYKIFHRKSYAMALATMVLFFPMTSYIGAGINSDNLHNLLTTIFILLTIRFIESGWNTRQNLLLGTVIGLDLITKPQAYILIPIFIVAILIRWRWDEWRSILLAFFQIMVPIILIAGWQEIPKFTLGHDRIGATAYLAENPNYGGWDNFQSYARDYFHRLYSAMLVWHWGVFKWLGVIMPKPLWWVANRLLLVGIGVSTIRLFWHFYKKKIDRLDKVTLLALSSNFIYVSALFFFDWQFFQQHGRSLGMQARYYMPLLSLQLFVILHGITTLGWNTRVKEYIRKNLIIFFLMLQLSSLFTQLSIYYDLYPLNTFIDQLSQYKPDFAKGNWWYLWFSLYLTGIISTTFLALRNKPDKTG